MMQINKRLLATGLVVFLAGSALAQTGAGVGTPNGQQTTTNPQFIRLYSGLSTAVPGNTVFLQPNGPSGMLAVTPNGQQTTTTPMTGPYGGFSATQPGPSTIQPGPTVVGGANMQQAVTDTQLNRLYSGLLPGSLPAQAAPFGTFGTMG